MNVVPRPRFKINDGGEKVESVISQFSQSDVNLDTEGNNNQAVVAGGTVTVLTKGHTVKLQEAASRNAV